MTERVPRLVVLVNGLPGAGKTTLAGPLAAALGVPLFGKDAIKETIADVLGSDARWVGEPADRPRHQPAPRQPAPSQPVSVQPVSGQRAWSQALGAAAMEAIWTLLASSPQGVVEANLLASTRPHVIAGLARAGVDPADLVEVWCAATIGLARARFERRAPDRHAIHGVQFGLDEHWAQLSIEARPLGLGRVITVDTAGPVDVAHLVARVRGEDAAS